MSNQSESPVGAFLVLSGSQGITISCHAQAVAAGAAKAALPVGTTLVLGVLAGAFIGFGSFLALSVGGACPGLASANPGLQKMVLVRMPSHSYQTPLSCVTVSQSASWAC